MTPARLLAAIDDGGRPRIAGAFLLIALAGAFVPSLYVVHVLVLVLVYVALGMGMSIVVGLAGLLDLGYVAFYAVGAYSYAILNTHAGLGFWPSLAVGAVAAALVGVVLGLPTLRASGDYLALVTLGLGEIVRIVLLNWDPVTNGPRGIMGIQPPSVLGHPLASPREFFWVALAMASAATAIAYRIRLSRAGLTLLAIRDNESAAAALGHQPVLWKLFAFAVGAGVAGATGVFFASWQRFVSPNSFTLLESVLVLSIVVLAGYGRLMGIIGAAAFFVILPEFLRDFASARLLLYGILLVAVVVGQERARLAGQRRRGPVVPAPAEAVLPHPSAVSERGESPGVAGPGVRASPEDRETVLQIVGLRKSFGGIEALRGISFSVGRGDLVAVIGPNGAGKTTLFHCLAGNLAPDAGVAYLSVRGVLVSIPARPWRAARLGIARTFQDVRTFSSLSALENVEVALPEWGLGTVVRPFTGGLRGERARLEAQAKQMLAHLDGVDLERPIADLPLVAQKRIAIAQALATRPAVLLLDEPAAGMTPAERHQLLAELLRIKEREGLTLLLVEHDPQFVMAAADRVLVLDRGELIADGPPSLVREDRRVRQVYLGELDDEALACSA